MNVTNGSWDQEDWARDLLHEASDTIDVAPASSFSPSPAEWRPGRVILMVVAAATLLVAAITFSGWFGDDPPDPTKGVSDQVPSVFGYDADSARQLLEDEGWQVTTRDAPSCEPVGRALGTNPQAGSTPKSGRVDLLVSAPADNIACVPGPGVDQETRRLAWQVLDFARQGSPLEFSDKVNVVVNASRETMTAEEAALRNKTLMQDLVRVLTEDANAVRVEGGTWSTPLLTSKIDSGDSRCGGLELLDGFVDRESLLMYVALPAFNVAPTGECHFLNVFTTDGQIDGLVLRTGRVDEQQTSAAVPWVAGLSIKQARALLHRAGFDITESSQLSCRGGTVLEQKPANGTDLVIGSAVHLTVGDSSSLFCVSSTDFASQELPKFAKGLSSELAIASTLDLYLGDKFMKTITSDQAVDPNGWDVCEDYAARTCPMSVLDTLAGATQLRTLGAPTPVPCVGKIGDLPPELSLSTASKVERSATLEPVTEVNCVTYSGVQIWVNEAGELIAANLLLGDP